MRNVLAATTTRARRASTAAAMCYVLPATFTRAPATST
jgi:hypothetical protein